MKLADQAGQLALEVHNGHINKHDGEPYVKHLHRVYALVRDEGGSEVQLAIAWLHDSVEDEKITLSDISRAIESDVQQKYDLLQGIDSITKRKGESNEEYYYRLKRNVDGRFVKYYGDLPDNFSRNHNLADPAVAARMAKKYSLGVSILK